MQNVLDHPARRTIVSLLRQGELAAGAMADALGRRRPGVSYHLSVLNEGGLVHCRIDGQRRIYRLDVERLSELLEVSLEEAYRVARTEAVA